MNTVSMTGHIAATDGLKGITVGKQKRAPTAESVRPTVFFPNSAAEVVENIAQSIATEKSDIENIQKITDIINGHTLQFSVNKELGKVIIEVVDPSTNKVIREIPSEEMQRLQANLKHTMGLVFDETI
ncbi:MAG: flagellar protein FlaG [Treponema sp.]|nr:flagellar protein FlaG [Treponema sp.]